MVRTRKKRNVGVALVPIVFRPRPFHNSILLNHFPSEVWIMILDEVEDQSEDFKPEMDDLSQASPFFRSYFFPRRVTLLVPKVIQHLQKYLGPEFLKCRLICSSWNKAIQDYYQHHPSHLEITSRDSKNWEIFRSDKYSTEMFQSWDRIQDFHNHFRGDSVKAPNPFLARSVTFHPPPRSPPPANLAPRTHNPTSSVFDRDPEIRGDLYSYGLDYVLRTRPGQLTFNDYADLEDQLNLSAGRLLESLFGDYGHHIWHCSLDLPSDRNGDVNMGSQEDLESWLEDLPNLQVLKIALQGNELPSNHPCYRSIYKDRGFWFPYFKNLQVLQVENMPTAMFDDLLKENKHIVKLKVTRKHAGLYLFQENLPNLRAFSWSLSAGKEFLELRGDGRAKWALEELHLKFDFGIRYPFLKWASIFHEIQSKWGPTLRNLEIQMPKVELGSDQKLVLEETLTARWKLPKVKYLKLTLPCPAFIDFMLPMKNLEEVHVIFSNVKTAKMVEEKRKKLEEKETIKFMGIMEDMRSSNIWKKLPKLKKLEVTRGDEHFCTKVENTKSS